MENFKIPERFCIFGREFKVEFVENLAQDLRYKGLCDPDTGVIKIQKNLPGYKVTPQSQEQTFFHELVHAILDAMNERELYSNEKFVDIFACILHQVMVSRKDMPE